MAFLYVPNGMNMADWTPKDEGAGFELPPTLEPLQAFKDDLLVLTGLTADKARPHGDGAGDHARAMASFLTGRQPRKTDGADIRVGISADQVAAQTVGQATRFASLEIGCEGGKNAGNCDSGYSCAYSSNLSWRGESTPMSKEINPRLVFDRLFSTARKGDDDAARRDRYKQSILDFVAEDAKSLQSTLGANDQRKLDEYLTGVRELELRIAKAPPAVELGASKMDRPTGVPGDYQEHIRLMGDLLVLAFQADLTRIATFVFANDGSNRSYRVLGVARGPSRPVAPRRQQGEAGEDPEDQRIPHRAVRLPAGEAEGDPRGRRHAAGQLHDRLRQRHQRRQPPQPRRPADPAGRQGRRHDQDGPARPAIRRRRR